MHFATRWREEQQKNPSINNENMKNLCRWIKNEAKQEKIFMGKFVPLSGKINVNREWGVNWSVFINCTYYGERQFSRLAAHFA